MKKWMYVVIGIAVVVGVVLAVHLAHERPPVENDVPAPNGDVVDNGVPPIDDNGVPPIDDNGAPPPADENGVPPSDENGIPPIVTATSLRFSVEATNAETWEMTYMAKDIGTEDFKLRMEWRWDGLEEGAIINGELRQIWYLDNGVWIEEDMAHEYWDTFWDMFVTEFEAYRTELYEWSHGDWSYTEDGYLVRIHDIEVDPDLPDALFAP